MKVRVAIVTNIPAPYRLPVLERLANELDIELCVFFCSGHEPDREWDLGASSFKHVFLRERFVNFRGRFIHANPDLWGQLRANRPEVVVTTGFNPTHLLSYVYARLYGAKHVAMTDGTFQSESRLSSVHRWVRRSVYKGSRAFVGASDGAFELYRSYGIDAERMFKSHLCANNRAFFNEPVVEKRFDFIFCGRFVAAKNPLFAVEVARSVAQRLGRPVSILFVGSGAMESQMRAASASAGLLLESVFAGFARQDELPRLYGSARILLFPTQLDVWGVVANEACAAGLPVLVSPFAGSAGELILDGQNGFVLPLNVRQWSDAGVRLLSDGGLYASMSAKSRALVHEYNFENATAGLANAIRASVSNHAQTLQAPRRAVSPKRPRVVVIQRRMTHYRVPLFDLMRKEFDQAGIDLTVVYGDPTRQERKKLDSGTLSWGLHVPCTYWLNGQVCWQNSFASVRGADLVVVTQENKLILNHLLLLKPRRFKLAFWGHGANLQSDNPDGLKEVFKRWTSTQVDWWFAYTDMSADLVTDAGFPDGRVTVLKNAIDTSELRRQRKSVTPEETHVLRQSLGFGEGPVAVYLGSLHKEKRLDFLFAAAEFIHLAMPDFQLLIVGDGPEGEFVREWCATHRWARWGGARFGRDKVAYLSVAQVMLNPGALGLSILDSFACGVPMLTTDCGLHSPEISYLQNGYNGVITANELTSYAQAGVGLLRDAVALDDLRAGCLASAEQYTLEHMAARFLEGVRRCLDAPVYRGRGTV